MGNRPVFQMPFTSGMILFPEDSRTEEKIAIDWVLDNYFGQGYLRLQDTPQPHPLLKVNFTNDLKPIAKRKNCRCMIFGISFSFFTANFNTDKVRVQWTTESELNNAGFNIYRSETRNGEFGKVNAELIHGAGTTGERKKYVWIDTTAKSNVEYYYQIEDVSFSGERRMLSTSRTKGVITSRDRILIQWGRTKQ